MRRITVVGMIILGLVAVPLVVSAKVSPKVSVCHVDGKDVGRVIEVSGNALAAHQAHGDGIAGDEIPDPCDTEPPVEETELPNQAPTARIEVSYGCTGSLVEICQYTLDGTSSTDPESTDLIYFWTVSSLPFSPALTQRTIFLDPPASPVTVTLTVSDGELSSEPVSVTVP